MKIAIAFYKHRIIRNELALISLDHRYKSIKDLRLAMIKHDGYFGDHKSISFYEKGDLKDKVWELRWNDGRRVYYAYIPEKKILLLLGGNKNGQGKDVIKTKALYLKITKN